MMVANRPGRHRQTQWGQLLGPLARGERPLRIELFSRLVAAIARGRLQAGDALPSIRALAGELGISRNTVIQAYALLMNEGLAASSPRSGFFISRSEAIEAPASTTAEQRSAALDGVDWQHRFRGSAADMPRLLKTSCWRDCKYQFVYGQYDAHSFPIRQWREAERTTMSVSSLRRWGADPYDSDDPELVRQIRDRILPRRGIWATDEEILVTAGTQNALYLITRLLVGPSTRAAVEDPGYPDCVAVMLMYGAGVDTVPVDGEGLVVDNLLPEASLVYCTPSHQYPTTVTMSRLRRQALLAHARAHDAIIIEDDYESESRFSGQAIPALKSLDTDGRVIFISSFSKSLAPGLRVGFVVGARELIAELRLLRRFVLRNPPTNNQHALANFIRYGYYDSHLQRLRRTHWARYAMLRNALERELPELSYPALVGGSAIWLRLPPEVDAAQLATRMITHSVYAEIGDWLFRSPHSRSYLRIGFSSIAENLISDGIGLLAKGVRDEQAGGWTAGRLPPADRLIREPITE